MKNRNFMFMFWVYKNMMGFIAFQWFFFFFLQMLFRNRLRGEKNRDRYKTVNIYIFKKDGFSMSFEMN